MDRPARLQKRKRDLKGLEGQVRGVVCSFQGICGSKNLKALKKLVPAGTQGRHSWEWGLLGRGTGTAA